MVLLGVLLVAGERRLGTWNIRNFSSDSRTDAEVGVIALVAGRYDLLAMQEILDEESVQRVAKALEEAYPGEGWGYVVSQQVGTNKKERYAFLWRASAFTLEDSWVYDDGDSPDFEREPFCGHFSGDGPGDFAVCTIHVVYGSSLEPRRAEILSLVDVVDDAESRIGSDDVYVCGDFNMPPTDASWSGLAAIGYVPSLLEPQTSTIGDVSLYDNVWTRAAGLEGTAYVYQYDEVMFDNRDAANLVVSDHRPTSVTVPRGGGARPTPGGTTVGSTGFAALAHGGIRVGAWSAAGRSPAPWSSTQLGVVATAAQHYDLLLLPGGLVTAAEADALADVLTTSFEEGTYVAEGSGAFLYRTDAMLRASEIYVAGDADLNCTCAAFESGSATFTACGVLAPADAAPLLGGLYDAAAASPQAEGSVLLAGSFGADVTSSAFDDLRSRGVVETVSPAATDTTLLGAQLVESTVFAPTTDVTEEFVSAPFALPFEDWWLPGEQQRFAVPMLSAHRPVRVLVDNGDGFVEAPNCALFFSQYYEGESYDKALEVYNPTPSPAPLSFYSIRKYTNGDYTTIELGEGVVTPGEAYVFANPRSNEDILKHTDYELGALTFTGDDSLLLVCDGTIVDTIGSPDADATSGGWTVAGVPQATEDNSMERRSFVTKGAGDDWPRQTGTNRYNSQWEIEADLTKGAAMLGSHTVDDNVLGVPTTSLLIGEYVEGTSYNKAIQVKNPSGVAVDMRYYTVLLTTGFNVTLVFAGVLDAGDTYWIVNPQANASLTAIAGRLSGNIDMNGNDAVMLYAANDAVRALDTLVDCVGDPLAPPPDGVAWDVAAVPDATLDHTLVRNASVVEGNGGDWQHSASPDSAANSEWQVYPADTVV